MGSFNQCDTIEWVAVNGPRKGVIEKEAHGGYLVRLPDGRLSVVCETSIRNKEYGRTDT